MMYKEGDYVVVRNIDTTPGVNKKLIPKFKGPYGPGSPWSGSICYHRFWWTSADSYSVYQYCKRWSNEVLAQNLTVKLSVCELSIFLYFAIILLYVFFILSRVSLVSKMKIFHLFYCILVLSICMAEVIHKSGRPSCRRNKICVRLLPIARAKVERVQPEPSFPKKQKSHVKKREASSRTEFFGRSRLEIELGPLPLLIRIHALIIWISI